VIKSRKKHRRPNGNSLAEMPAALYLLFVGIFIPLLALAVFSYRISLVFFAVRDAACQAAKSQTFTAAQAAASSSWAHDISGWNGISGTENLVIVIHSIADGGNSGTSDGAETISSTALPQNSVNTATKVYFYRTICTCTMQPWFGGKWIGLKIPGLTAPYTSTMNYQEVVESTAGLSS
jgi:hypothetical protein